MPYKREIPGLPSNFRSREQAFPIFYGELLRGKIKDQSKIEQALTYLAKIIDYTDVDELLPEIEKILPNSSVGLKKEEVPFFKHKDKEEALKDIYRLGADLGNAKSMLNLAILYEGKPKSFSELRKSKEILEHIISSEIGDEREQRIAERRLNDFNTNFSKEHLEKAEEGFARFLQENPSYSDEQLKNFLKENPYSDRYAYLFNKFSPAGRNELRNKPIKSTTVESKASTAPAAAPVLSSNPIKVGTSSKTTPATSTAPAPATQAKAQAPTASSAAAAPASDTYKEYNRKIKNFFRGDTEPRSAQSTTSADRKKKESEILYDLGERLVFNGDNSREEIKEGIKFLEKAGNLGNAEALELLGNIYAGGIGGYKNPDVARQYFKMALEKGYKPDQSILTGELDPNENSYEASMAIRDAFKEYNDNLAARSGDGANGYRQQQAINPNMEEYFKDFIPDNASTIPDSEFTAGWKDEVPQQTTDLPEINLNSGVPDFEFQQDKDGEDWRMAHARNAATLALDELKKTDDVNPNATEAPLDDLELRAQQQLLNHVENRSQGLDEKLRREEYRKLRKDSPGFRVAKDLLNKSAKDFEGSDLEQYYNPYDKEVIAEMKKDFEDSLRKKIEALNSSYVGRNLYAGTREKAIENLTRDSEREWQRHKTSLLKDRLDQAYNKYFKEKEHALNTGLSAARVSQEDRNLGLRNLSDWRTESNAAEASRLQNIGNVMALGEKNRALGTEMLRSQDQKIKEANAARNRKIDRYVSVATGHQLPNYEPAAPIQPQMQQTAPSGWTTAASIAPTIFNAVNAKKERDMKEEQHNLQAQYFRNNPGVQPVFKFAEGGSVTDNLLNSLKRDMLKRQSDEADSYAKRAINVDPVMEGLTNFGTAMLQRAPGDVGFSSIGNALQSANEGIESARKRSDEYSSKEMALRAAMYNTMRVAEKDKQAAIDKERDFALKERKFFSTERHQKSMEDMKREELALKKYSISMKPSKADEFNSSVEKDNVKNIIKKGAQAAQSIDNIRKAKILRESQGLNVPYIGSDTGKFQDSLSSIDPKYINKKITSIFAKSDLDRLNEAEIRALADVKKAEFYKKMYSEGMPIDEINKRWEDIVSDIYEFEGQKKNKIARDDIEPSAVNYDSGKDEIPEEIKEIVSRNSDSYLTKLVKDTPRLARGLVKDVEKVSKYSPSLISQGLNKAGEYLDKENKGDGVLTKLYDLLTRDKFKPREGKESPGIRDVAGSAAESIAALPDLALAPVSHLVGKDLTLGKRAKGLFANPNAEENVASDLAGDAVGMLIGFGAAGKAAKLAKFEKLGEFLSSGTKLTTKNLGQAGLNLGLFNQYEEVLPEGALGTTAAAFLAAISPNASKKVIEEFSNKMKGVIKKVPPAQQKEVAQDLVSRLKDDGFTPFVTTKDPSKHEGALEFLYRTTAKSIQDFVERSNLQKTAVHEGHAKNVNRIKEKIGIPGKNTSSELYGEGIKKGAERFISKTHKEGNKLLNEAVESVRPFDNKIASKDVPGTKAAEFINKTKDKDLKKFASDLFSDYVTALKTKNPIEIFKEADLTLKKLNTEIAGMKPKTPVEKNTLNELNSLKDVFLGELDAFFVKQPKKVGESYKKYREHYSKFYADVSKTKQALGKDFKKLGTEDTPESFSQTMSSFFSKDPNTFKEIAKHSTPKELKQFTDEVIFNLGVGTEQGTKNIFSPINFSKRFKDLPKENAERLEEIFRKSNPNSKESLSEVVELIDILSPKTPQELKVKALPKTSESLFTFTKNVGLRLFNLMFSPRLLGSMLSKDGLLNKKFNQISKNFTKKEWSDFIKNITNDLHKDKRFDDPKHELIKTRFLKALNNVEK